MTDTPTPRRVLLALDPLSRSQAALRTAGALAAELDAELAGLFVEDINLARLFALPFARELCVFSGELRPVSKADVERGWRREAAALEQRLAEAAGEWRVRWSFQVTRGHVAAEARVQARALDLLVLGERAAALSPSVPKPTDDGPVAVLADPVQPHAAIDLGVRLARRRGTGVVLLIPEGVTSASVTACEAGESAARAGGVNLRCVPLEGHDSATLLRAIRRAAVGCLVVSNRDRLLESNGLKRLLDGADCPIVLAG